MSSIIPKTRTILRYLTILSEFIRMGAILSEGNLSPLLSFAIAAVAAVSNLRKILLLLKNHNFFYLFFFINSRLLFIRSINQILFHSLDFFLNT